MLRTRRSAAHRVEGRTLLQKMHQVLARSCDRPGRDIARCLGAAAGCVIVMGAASGQTSLQRTVINVPEDPSVPPGWPMLPAHAGVDLTAGPHRVRLDLLYGGVPRYWHLYGEPDGWQTSLIWPNMGAAMQVVWDFGQDSTQGTPNGTTTNPISHPGDPASVRYNYYARETLFQTPTINDPRAIYEVTGFGPFYWVSAEGREDAIPDTEASWCTGYNGGTCVYNPGWPVEFRPTGGSPSEGMLFVGNQFRFNGSWNQRLVEIAQGRVAFKVKVDLSQASASGFAGVMFRKQVPTGGAASRADAFAAPGYMILMNRSGDVNLQRQNGAGGNVVVLSGPGAAPQAATRAVQLEVRTHNFFTGLLEVFVDDVRIGEFTDPIPIRGPHIGLYAFTDAGSRVRFSDRSIYDVGYEFVSRYTGTPEGAIESDIQVRPAPFSAVVRPLAISPAMPGLQFNPYYQPGPLNSIGAWTPCGQLVQHFIDINLCSQSCSVPGPNPTTGVSNALYGCTLTGTNDATSAFWAGNEARTRGLFVEPVSADLNGAPSPRSYSGAIYDPAAGPLLVVNGTSPVEFFQTLFNCPGPSMNSMRSVTRWSLSRQVAGAPVVTSFAAPSVVCPGGTAVLTMGADGAQPLQFRWWRGSSPLADGPTGTGSVRSGSATSTLAISNFGVADGGGGVDSRYYCVVTSLCGTDTSASANPRYCPADFDCSGTLNSVDFFDFLVPFFAASSAADYNHDGTTNSQDFFDFLAAFFAGC